MALAQFGRSRKGTLDVRHEFVGWELLGVSRQMLAAKPLNICPLNVSILILEMKECPQFEAWV